MILGPSLRVYACPACKTTVNTVAAFCPHCGGALDPKLADERADLQSSISQLYSDADFALIVGGMAVTVAVWTFWFGAIVLLVGCILSGAAVFMALRVMARIARLKAEDADLKRARMVARRALGVALVVPVTAVVVVVLAVVLGISIRR